MEKKHVSKLLCSVAAGMLLSPIGSFAASDLQSAFSEGVFTGSLRYMDWSREFDGASDADNGRSTALGGWFSYETAPLSGLTGGFGFRVAHDLTYADGYGEFYGLLPEGNESVAQLAEGFLRYNGFDTIVTVGDQFIDTPYMNANDFRMMPHSFQGVSVVNNSISNLEFQAGYMQSYMAWDSSDWEDMLGEDGAATYIGASYDINRGMNVNAWYFNYEDAFSIITPQFTWFKMINPDLKTKIDLRFAKADSIGDELEGELDTYTGGFIGLLLWKNFTFAAFMSQTGDDSMEDVETYGHRRPLTMTINRAQRAEEFAWSLKIGYAFTGALDGLSIGARYGAFDTPDDTDDENFSQDYVEYDLELIYECKKNTGIIGFLKPTRFELKYAYADHDEDTSNAFYNKIGLGKLNEDVTDIRFSIYYDF